MESCPPREGKGLSILNLAVLPEYGVEILRVFDNTATSAVGAPSVEDV